MDIKNAFFFMALHLKTREVVERWVKMLPNDAVKWLNPMPSSGGQVVVETSTSASPVSLPRKWLHLSRKEQTLQGRCREVIQETFSGEEMAKLPLPPIILDNLRELEAPLCFRILYDIYPILSLQTIVEEIFT